MQRTESLVALGLQLRTSREERQYRGHRWRVGCNEWQQSVRAGQDNQGNKGRWQGEMRRLMGLGIDGRTKATEGVE
jgi:hypothetical protein